MNIDELLNLMDDIIDNAWSVPLSGGKRMVDVDQVSDILDDIRLNLPMEIKHAKAIVADRAGIVMNAKNEGEEIIKKAEARARILVSDNEVMRTAKEEANELLNEAQMQARQIRKAVTLYVDNLVGATEKSLIASLNNVRDVRKEYREKNKF